MCVELRVLEKTLPIKMLPIAQLGGRHASQHGTPVGATKLARQFQDKLTLTG